MSIFQNIDWNGLVPVTCLFTCFLARRAKTDNQAYNVTLGSAEQKAYVVKR